MAQYYAKAFYKSAAWRYCRDAYVNSVYSLCERCGRACWRKNDAEYIRLKKLGEDAYYGIVHHIDYITPMNINDPNITLNWNNLELLCQDCHNKEHNSSETIRNELVFDSNGRLIKKKNG